ncbi:hypothetical protein JOQ06_014387 [Pogonophryne albipinna]|uniref:Sperm microtubule inner protein 1 C-terminal domain-containing protein n=1 Tax=Pogonophryne albipinna TaxID=1090488 RepID=A0AAD6FAQ3_9TELE|nr:hypothetical protein JOQ06_014387 [Pogonophryne albipinna]
MLTRLSWKKRYSHLYPSNDPQNISTEGTNLPGNTQPVSPKTRNALYQDSSHHGKGRRLYLQRRGNIRPEEKFDFPLLSSWEYGWRLGELKRTYPADVQVYISV